MDDDADLIHRTRVAGLIGVGSHGLHRPPGMSELRGETALVQLGLDYRSFCKGNPIRRTKAFREVLAAYQRVARRVIALHPNAVLANR